MASEERAHRSPLGSRSLSVDQAHLPIPFPRRRFEILLHDGNHVPRGESVQVDALLHRHAVRGRTFGGIRPDHDPEERTDATWCSDGTGGDAKSSEVWFFFAISRSSSKGILTKAATIAGSKWVSDISLILVRASVWERAVWYARSVVSAS
jgi:hypothetical protein